jgi:hypothetical protein
MLGCCQPLAVPWGLCESQERFCCRRHFSFGKESGRSGHSIGRTAPNAHQRMLRHVAVLLVPQVVEAEVEGLHLRFGSRAQNAMPLRELHRVPKHVQLGKRLLTGGVAPVSVDVVQQGSKLEERHRIPLARAQQKGVQLLRRCADGARSRSHMV